MPAMRLILQNSESYKQKILDYFALFGSMSTLICCALPALLVSVGLGAALAGIVTHVPGLIWLSEHKIQLFWGSGILLLLNGWLIYRNKDAPCPLDPVLRASCLRSRRNSLYVFIVSVFIYAVGFIFAFLF
jgi:hypothetical protein